MFLLRCVLIFWSPPCWVLTLWLPLFAIPPLHSACSYDPICATGKFTLGVWSVMVLWVATMVPWWNLGPPCGRSAHGCAAGCALVSRFLVMIYCRTTPMCYFHMSSSLVISPYHGRRSVCWIRCNGLPSGVIQRLTFEEQVTNRLQEMVDKWLYSTWLSL